MTRTDDDSWDITESVGATALGVAMARAAETASARPLFIDHFAQWFIDAATAAGWQPSFGVTPSDVPDADPAVVEQLQQRVQSIWGYAAARTKHFDDFFTSAGAAGIRQVVILAAGLDARAWRLPWVADTVVYEIDQPKVLEFKADTLRRPPRAAGGEGRRGTHRSAAGLANRVAGGWIRRWPANGVARRGPAALPAVGRAGPAVRTGTATQRAR